MSKRVVNLLGLRYTPKKGQVALEGGKTIPSYREIEILWCKGQFRDSTQLTVLEIDNDIILGKDFWFKYKAIPDYESFGLTVFKNGRRYTLSGFLLLVHLFTLQGEDQDQKATVESDTHFTRHLTKDTEVHL